MERSEEEVRERLSGVSDPMRLLEGIFAHAPVGLQIVGPGGQSLVTNAAFRDLFGSDDEFARDHGSLELIQRAFQGETVHTPPIRYRCVLTEATLFPLFDRDGKVGFVAVVVKKAEEAERRANLLAEVGAILVGSVDYVAALQEVARLTIPRLGKCCTIDVIDDGQWSRVAAAHADPAKQPLLDELRVGELGVSLSVPLQSRGRVVGALSVARDVGEPPFARADVELVAEVGRRVASAIEIAQLYQKAREAIRARDEFLSIASHELKTPLTPLQLQIDLLKVMLAQLGIDRPQLSERVTQIGRQARRLAALIENLLDVSRISVGRLSLEPEELDLFELATEVAQHFADEARRAECSLDVSGGAVRGKWDRSRLEQVVSNLLSNALKYGAGHPIEVVVGELDGQARLSVHDFGIGIAEDSLQRIFERFERAASARHYGGFGLGLYIARRIVEAHGGTIGVQSRLGHGSLFTTLPRGVA